MLGDVHDERNDVAFVVKLATAYKNHHDASMFEFFVQHPMEHMC